MSRSLRTLIIALTLLTATAIAAADVSQYAPDTNIFNMIPVAVAAYYLGYRYGWLVAIVAATAQVIIHVVIAPVSSYGLVAIDVLSLTIVFFLTSYLIDRFVNQLRIITALEKQRSDDLTIAKNVHRSTFAPVPSRYGDLSIGSRAIFARELGGDYYLVKGIGERLFCAIGDIAGKSTSAALFTALLAQSVSESLEHTLDLPALISRVNDQMHSTLPDDMFVTMFIALIDGGRLDYVNAGHPPPLLYRNRETGTEMETGIADGGKTLSTTGCIQDVDMLRSEPTLPLGVFPRLEIPMASMPFEAGDVLLAFTDGVTDSAAFRQEPYMKLSRMLLGAAQSGAQDIVDSIFAAAISETTRIEDDAVMFAVKKEG